MIYLKGQLHIHTTFSDGRLTPQEMADIYASLGFDFIAFTDHDHLLKPTYRKAIEEVRTNMLVFFGIELTIRTRWGYVHVNEIEGETEKLYIFNHPADYGLTIKQTLECIEDVSRDYKIDGAEVTHRGFYTPDYDIDLIPYPKVASDDSHVSMACGRAWIEMDSKRDKDTILRQIKEGGFRCRYAKGKNQPIIIA